MNTETKPYEEMTADERQAAWQNRPRPLPFVRIRVRLDTAEYLAELLEDERDHEYEQLADMRSRGLEETSPDIAGARDHLGSLIWLIKEIHKSKIELVGPSQE
jgi:hypothetical protein